MITVVEEAEVEASQWYAAVRSVQGSGDHVTGLRNGTCEAAEGRGGRGADLYSWREKYQAYVGVRSDWGSDRHLHYLLVLLSPRTGCLTRWLSNWLCVCRFDRLTDWLCRNICGGFLTGYLDGGKGILADDTRWLFDCRVAWQSMANFLNGWMDGCSAGSLYGLMAGWLCMAVLVWLAFYLSKWLGSVRHRLSATTR